MFVICTAGHVDHGKSTLVRALTGMEPDRLAEERRRSMTIDLGFAWFDLPREGGGVDTVAFVDLPGHHRFLSNMLAGASSVGVALVVVSADDGPMPQTFEHLEILDLLGVRHGVLAVTKSDLVDETTLQFAVELSREALAGTSLQEAPIVPVSAAAGDNLPALRKALDDVLAEVPAETDDGRPRLWIDRSFSVRGAGTVVTGTLRQGSLAIDDEILVAPGPRMARIRGLQCLGQQLKQATPGGRVALNLVGFTKNAARRGDAVVRPGQWLDVTIFEAWVRALPDRPILRKGDWHLHCGSGEWRVELSPVSGRTIPAGGDGFVRVTLDEPVPVAPGDHFVLRESGHQTTVGGGLILDVAPGRPAKGRAGREDRSARLRDRLAALRTGDRVFLLVDHAMAHGLVPRREAAAIGGLGPGERDGSADPRLVPLGSALVAASDAARWRQRVAEVVADAHGAHPMDRAVPKDVAARAAVVAGCPTTIVSHVLGDAVSRRELVVEGSGVRLPSHQVKLDSEQTRSAELLLELLESSGFSPPDLAGAVAESQAQSVVRELEAAGRLIRISADLAMTPRQLNRAHELLHAAYLAEGPLTAARARDVLGTTRKYVLPLMAALDQRGCTRRQGDLRIVMDPAHHDALTELRPASS